MCMAYTAHMYHLLVQHSMHVQYGTCTIYQYSKVIMYDMAHTDTYQYIVRYKMDLVHRMARMHLPPRQAGLGWIV